MIARPLSFLLIFAGASLCSAALTVTRVALPTNDIVYDPISDQILASVPSRAGAQRGNTITPVNPYTGALGTSVFVASEPNTLALANDGSRVYVSSDTTNFVTPFSLLTMTPGVSFPIGPSNQRVDDMEVAPGNAAALAVATKNNSGSPRGTGVAVFLDGVRLPKSTEAINNVIEFGATAGVLYGHNNESSIAGLMSYSVDLSPTGGLTAGYSEGGIVTHSQQHMEFENGRLYFTNGQVVQASPPALLGSYTASGPVEPVSSTGRTYFFDGNVKKLKSFRQATFVPLGEMTIPQYTGPQRNLVALGNSALALATHADELFIIRLDGDYDANGIVTAADYEVWKANYGSVMNRAADANRDNIVDTADWVIWRDTIGHTLVGSVNVGSAAHLSVPESSSGMLFFLSLVSGLTLMRNRQFAIFTLRPASYTRCRNKEQAWLTSLFAILIAGEAYGAPIEWPVTAGGNGHFYEYIPGAITWQQANTRAQLRRHNDVAGHLATLTSEPERAFTRSQFTSRYWIGGFQNRGSPNFSEPAGGWEWVTGEPFSYTKWNPGEPNEYDRSKEDFLEADPAGGRIGWNDAPNAFGSNNGYLVEYSLLTPGPANASVFYDNFDGGAWTASSVVASYSGITETESVRGFAGIGTGPNVFSGNLLRNQTGIALPFLDVPQSPVIRTLLHLTGLPEHVSIDVNFLLAAIDSWDGDSEYAAPDIFNVVVDGRSIFSETLDHLYLADQSYQPPAGVLLIHGTNVGFSEFPDAAYNLGLDQKFDRIPHTASELTVEFFASGSGWTAAYHGNESWGIDNLEIRLNKASADFNNSGTVDAADYVLWRNSLGQMGTGLAADGNGDGAVDIGDYDLWQAHFGRMLGSSFASSAVVPEPAVALVLLAVTAVIFARRPCRSWSCGTVWE